MYMYMKSFGVPDTIISCTNLYQTITDQPFISRLGIDIMMAL